ncbi:MAG: hypothetical protein Alis3KO_40100 [Aliiglaciecola sp.]
MVENDQKDSPFHEGELSIQSREGKREFVASYANKVIRDFMPEQHRDFYQQLPFAVFGSVDEQGFPWASIMPGLPGFIGSPNANTLTLPSKALPGDPLNSALSRPGAAIGMLGIEMATRRRNRVNMRVESVVKSRVNLRVDQSFGNCPQYIQSRDIEFSRSPEEFSNFPPPSEFSKFDQQSIQLIDNADTFFVASFIQANERPDIEGVDVSHRGGMPGFVKRDHNVLTIPDYSGNNHFNTLGNFLLNPKAGIVFPDFNSGDLLMLTGEVEILWNDHPQVIAFEGAQRAWRFKLSKGIWLKDALPFTTSFNSYSPSTTPTDTWQKVEARQAASNETRQWQSMKLERITQESVDIKSFYFKHAKNKPLLSFKPGQHLTIKVPVPSSKAPVIRHYTLSSAPSDEMYRISIKQEQNGEVSNYMHEHAKVGDLFDVKFPSGSFYMDANARHPAVLLAAGVGITPMISMARHVLNEGNKTGYVRQLNLFHVNKTWEQTPFKHELESIMEHSQGEIRYFPFTSQGAATDSKSRMPPPSGRMTLDLIKANLGFDKYDFYLCGPAAFMQSLYEQLIDYGVQDERIFAEAFGPSRIKRKAFKETLTSEEPLAEADSAIVTFKQSKRVHKWKAKDPTLLEVAEQQGLAPEYSCRMGSCGSCAVKLHSGSVTYRQTISADVRPGEALLCCAVPAAGSDKIVIDL